MPNSETNAEKSAKFVDFLCSLPQEFKAEILSRLPLKTVAQSRAFCRAWNLFHGDPSVLDMLDFCKFSLNRTWVFLSFNRIHTSVFFIELYDDAAGEEEDNKAYRMIREIDLPFSDEFSPCFGIVGSCNGLLCLAQLLSYTVQRIYLHNPLTKTFKLLPKNSLISKVDYRDESYESVFGFGYNPSAQDYTMVSVDYVKISKQEEKTNACVYTLKSKTWKRANNLPVHRFGTRFAGGVLAGGRLHWLRDDKLGIVSFDLADNFFGEVPMDLPRIVRKIYMLPRLHIAVLGGCLSLVVDEGFQIVIWGMREYGVKESWESMYTLRWLFYEEYTFVGGSNSIRVLGLRKNGDILLAIDSVGLVSYNPRDEAVGLVFKGDGFEAAEDCVRVSDLITPSALCF